MIKILDYNSNGFEEAFGKIFKRDMINKEDVAPRVEDIIKNIKQDGDKALILYTEKFDGAVLNSDTIKVTQKEIDEAYVNFDSKLLEVIRKAQKNIQDFHEKQKEKSWFTTEDDGVLLGQLIRPLETVGVYVPGGTAPLPSSVLMNVVPAKVAGVKNIVMATPPGKTGVIHPAILVAAMEAGVDEIYKVGGAQAIAALAFGTQTIKKVDKIVGPGNIYVATAKRMVYGYCDIDMIAGPSEIMVLADESAKPSFIAADLLSQAEHDILSSSILVTVSKTLANEVQNEIEKQLILLQRKEMARRSIDDFGVIITVDSIEKGLELVNKVAPEHLELCVNEPFNLLGSVKNAGAIFLGSYASEPLGDYFAGPNHVLPTAGTARFFSPLNLSDFIKKSSVISYTKEALLKVKDDVVLFAEAEGLTGHANAIKVRFED